MTTKAVRLRALLSDAGIVLVIGAVGGILSAGTWLGLLLPCYILCPIAVALLVRCNILANTVAVNLIVTYTVFVGLQGWKMPYPSDYVRFGLLSLIEALVIGLIAAFARSLKTK